MLTDLEKTLVENMNEPQQDCKYIHATATLLLRLALGLMFLTAGVGKISHGVGGFVQYLLEQFKGTFLPAFFLQSFGYVLPFAETAIGALLLAGLFTRPAFFFASLLSISLFWGQFLIGQYDVAAHNAIYVLFAVLSLRWSSDNMLSLDCLRKKKSL